jgi:hypothetical protein
MKFLVLNLCLALSSLSMSQYYEEIKERSKYFPDSSFVPRSFLNELFQNQINIQTLKVDQPHLAYVNVGIVSDDDSDDASFMVFFESFDFIQYQDTSRYKVAYQLDNVLKGSTLELNDPDFNFEICGYSESVSILDKKRNKVVYIIGFNYLEFSTVISEAVVFESSSILQVNGK